jgi:TRAP-type C4-dicarboxylate transport system permease small subunit
LSRITFSFAFFAGISMLLMMFVGAMDILGTNLFGKPVPAAYEFIATMIAVVVYFSIAQAERQDAHIRVEIVVNQLPRYWQIAANIVKGLLSLIFFGLIAYFGWLSAFQSFGEGEYASGLINFPIWPSRFALAIGASLMAVQCVYGIMELLRRREKSGH